MRRAGAGQEAAGADQGTGRAGEAAEDRLLRDLIAQTGLVIDHRARLEQVARQAAEPEAAARRVVTAEDSARRRIECDLHDGAQQCLVSLGMELGALVECAAETGDPDLVRQAKRVRRQLLEATAELREMARAMRPAVLTLDGFEAAPANLADRSPVPARLHVSLGRRPRPEVEATGYFLVSEALTNAARHAGAGVVDVEVSLAGDRLVVEVRDDGTGGTHLQPRPGALQGLADRVEDARHADVGEREAEAYSRREVAARRAPAAVGTTPRRTGKVATLCRSRCGVASGTPGGVADLYRTGGGGWLTPPAPSGTAPTRRRPPGRT